MIVGCVCESFGALFGSHHYLAIIRCIGCVPTKYNRGIRVRLCTWYICTLYVIHIILWKYIMKQQLPNCSNLLYHLSFCREGQEGRRKEEGRREEGWKEGGKEVVAPQAI